MRTGFVKKSETRCEQIQQVLQNFNAEKFHKKNWSWEVGALGSWLELHGPRPIGLIPEESFEYQGSDYGRELSVGVKDTNSPHKNEKKVSRVIFENNSSSTPGDKGSLDEMELKNRVRLEEKLL